MYCSAHTTRTDVPGSRCGGVLTCGKERKSKCLVATGQHDERFQEERFLRAPAIFANNDLKYESNKIRAQQYAAQAGKAVTYSMAKDIPSAEALRERPDLPAHKLAWLQRHDRQSGDTSKLCNGKARLRHPLTRA
jgi:hypothetical protein